MPAAEQRDEPWEALAAELRERLRDSVRAHLVADVPVGVLLSGGIDSSALAALAATESTARVATFSIGFAERSFSEVELARTIAQRYGTDHHELVVEPDAAELLPTIAAAFDEPFADSSALPTYLVSRARRAARQGRAVGRGRRRAVRRLRDLRRRPARAARRRRRAAARAAGRAAAERLGPRAARLQAQALHARRAPAAARAPPRLEGDLLAGRARRAAAPDRRGSEDPLDVYRARWAETEGADTLARLQDVDRAIYLVDDLLVKTDRMSMAHSLELRVPFLDPAVAELALALPVRSARARLRQEAAAARGGRAARRPRDRARAQEGLLDPRRRLAARASSSRSAARSSAPSGCARRATSSRRRSRG